MTESDPAPEARRLHNDTPVADDNGSSTSTGPKNKLGVSRLHFQVFAADLMRAFTAILRDGAAKGGNTVPILLVLTTILPRDCATPRQAQTWRS